MALTTITQKVLGSDTYAEKKLLATDINQIREAIQTGALDIKPNNISMEGNEITADAGQNWIRRSGNKFQFYDAGTWKEPTTLETATFTAGEAISIRDVVYVNTSDGKIYKASSSNSDWIGVAIEAISSGSSGQVYLNGSLVGGFSGLTPGTWYKVNASAGTIDASDLSITNTQYNVGIAISSTQIILIKNQLNGITNEINAGAGLLGEIRQIALSLTGSLSKATLQGYGWAICDGTTPAAQGISDATITTTPDLRKKFLRHSADETTGGTGGSETHNHKWYDYYQNSGSYGLQVTAKYADRSGETFTSTGSTAGMGSENGLLNINGYTDKISTLPPYYDICYFIKVK